MTTLPPHPGLSGLAAREAGAYSADFVKRLDRVHAASARIAAASDPSAAAREEYPEFYALLDSTPTRPTTPAEVTRAADDDADHVRSVFVSVHLDRLAALARRHGLYADPVPCGCCGPQLCCCDCHKEET